MPVLSRRQTREIERLVNQNGGTLSGGQLLAAATDPQSPLHEQFKWDDAVAAHRYRLIQARQIIRIYVDPRGAPNERGLISLPTARVHLGTYFRTRDVQASPLQRSSAVDGALHDLASLRNRYAYLPELIPLWDAIDALVVRFRNGTLPGQGGVPGQPGGGGGGVAPPAGGRGGRGGGGAAPARRRPPRAAQPPPGP